jgi:restriction system protein
MLDELPPGVPSNRTAMEMTAVLRAWHWQQQRSHLMAATSNVTHLASLGTAPEPELSSAWPDVLIQAVVTFGDKMNEGQLIEAVAIPWFEIIRQLERDPGFMFKVHWRTLEEIIAGAYTREGFPYVTLTPRSGDDGRDVIATKPGVGSIRIFDQVKAYKPGHIVTREQVDSMLGVLTRDSNVSKGLVTTTSEFAPRLLEDESLKRLMPYRLELKNGRRLREWLIGLAKRSE